MSELSSRRRGCGLSKKVVFNGAGKKKTLEFPCHKNMDFQQIADAETFLFPLLPYVVIATSFLVVFGLTFIKSPYGRHAGKTYHLVMNAKVLNPLWIQVFALYLLLF